MSVQSEHESTPIIKGLEIGDTIAHQLVSLLLLALAIGIVCVSTFDFIADLVRDGLKDFPARGLEYLSGLLLGVIVLELLSTLITYMRSRSLESTIKDFLIVAIISSIRKILLIGAQSSVEHQSSNDEFIKEALGTGITILGIIALIGGLLLLERRLKGTASSHAD